MKNKYSSKFRKPQKAKLSNMTGPLKIQEYPSKFDPEQEACKELMWESSLDHEFAGTNDLQNFLIGDSEPLLYHQKKIKYKTQLSPPSQKQKCHTIGIKNVNVHDEKYSTVFPYLIKKSNHREIIKRLNKSMLLVPEKKQIIPTTQYIVIDNRKSLNSTKNAATKQQSWTSKYKRSLEQLNKKRIEYRKKDRLVVRYNRRSVLKKREGH